MSGPVRLSLAVVLVSMSALVAAGEWNRSGGSGGIAVREGPDFWRPGVRRSGQAATVRLQYTLVQEGRSWLDDDKLEAIGFPRYRERNPLPRLVWVVLERDSLLTIVDAGRDRAALAAVWTDAERYLLLRALAGTHLTRSPAGAPGYIQSLVPAQLYLPRTAGGILWLRTGRLGWPVLDPVAPEAPRGSPG